MKQVEISISKWDGYHIALSNNGTQWNTVYRDEDYGKALIILKAFNEVGFEDVTNYADIEEKIIKWNVHKSSQEVSDGN